jgi:hypothetical protein
VKSREIEREVVEGFARQNLIDFEYFVELDKEEKQL